MLFMNSLKTVVLILLVLISALPLRVQVRDWYVRLADEPIDKLDNGIPRIIFAEQYLGGFILVREQVYRQLRKRKFLLERLDLELKSVGITDITDDLDEQNFEIQDVLRLNDRLLFVSTLYKREEHTRYFYVQALDYASATLSKRFEVYRYPSEQNMAYNVEFITSPDENFLMFSIVPYKKTPWIKKPENDYREIILLNKDFSMNQVKGRIDMRVGPVDFWVEQTLLDNFGQLYFLSKKIPDKKSEEPTYYILRLKDSLESRAINFSAGLIHRARIELNPDQNMLFMGYYHEMKKFNPGVGVVSTVIDANTLNCGEIHADLIRNEVMMTGLSERERRKWQREIAAGRDFKLNQDIVPLYFFRHHSGHVSMIGEIQYVTLESSSISYSGTLNRFTYNYEHIFLTRIDPQGKIVHTVKIPKLYRGSDDLVKSFQASMHGEEIHFIFNDSQDNLIINPRKGTRYVSPRPRFNFMVTYKVDARGEVENKSLFEYNTPPFNKIDFLSIYLQTAQTSQGHLLCTTSGRLGNYYLLIGNNQQ